MAAAVRCFYLVVCFERKCCLSKSIATCVTARESNLGAGGRKRDNLGPESVLSLRLYSAQADFHSVEAPAPMRKAVRSRPHPQLQFLPWRANMLIVVHLYMQAKSMIELDRAAAMSEVRTRCLDANFVSVGQNVLELSPNAPRQVGYRVRLGKLAPEVRLCMANVS